MTGTSPAMSRNDECGRRAWRLIRAASRLLSPICAVDADRPTFNDGNETDARPCLPRTGTGEEVRPGPRGREGKRPGADAKAKGPRGSRCGPPTPSPAWHFGNLTKRDSCPSRSIGVVNRVSQSIGTTKDL